VLFVSEKAVARTSNNAYSLNPVNAIIFTVIGILREDLLSTGMLDVFFSKISYHVSLLLRELYILKNWRNFQQLRLDSLISWL
jgi:hypothetical protein